MSIVKRSVDLSQYRASGPPLFIAKTHVPPKRCGGCGLVWWYTAVREGAEADDQAGVAPTRGLVHGPELRRRADTKPPVVCHRNSTTMRLGPVGICQCVSELCTAAEDCIIHMITDARQTTPPGGSRLRTAPTCPLSAESTQTRSMATFGRHSDDCTVVVTVLKHKPLQGSGTTQRQQDQDITQRHHPEAARSRHHQRTSCQRRAQVCCQALRLVHTADGGAVVVTGVHQNPMPKPPQGSGTRITETLTCSNTETQSH